MHSYTFNTDLGTFEISNCRHHGYYALMLEDEKVGEYATAETAAEDVASFNTGYTEWDQLESDAIRVPQALSEWNKVLPDPREEMFTAPMPFRREEG